MSNDTQNRVEEIDRKALNLLADTHAKGVRRATLLIVLAEDETQFYVNMACEGSIKHMVRAISHCMSQDPEFAQLLRLSLLANMNGFQ